MHKFNRAKPSEKAKVLHGKKILSIYYKHKPGGLCKRLYMMFDALVQAGAEVHYIAVDPFPISDSRIVPHLLWVPFKNKEGILFWAYFMMIAPFYTFIIARRTHINLVSVFGAFYAFTAIWLKVLLQTPILVFVRSDPTVINRVLGHAPWRLLSEDRVISIGLRLSDRIVTVNASLMKNLSQKTKIAPGKMTVLHNHVTDRSRELNDQDSSRSKLGLDKSAFIILTMAVLDQRKNIELIIRSSPFLNPPALILIVGKGPEQNRLERLAQTMDKASPIVFTGWQSDVTESIKAADLFVLPSIHEGCSNALLEALSFGLPCLASDLPEHRDALASDMLLFDPMDANAFSNKVNRIMKEPAYFEIIKAHSEKARQGFLFDWDKTIVQIHADVLP